MTPACFVIIESHTSDDVQRVILTEADREALRETWDRPDILITRLSHLPLIGPVQAWSELSRAQVQALLAISVEYQDDSPATAALLRRSLTALLINLESECGWVKMMLVRHLAPLHIEVDVSLTIAAHIEFKAKPKVGRIRVIV